MVLYELPFVVNRTVWNEMPKDLQDIVRVGIVAADHKGQVKAELAIDVAWQKIAAYGITLVSWSPADTQRWVDAQFKWAKSYEDKDPNCAMLMNTVREYRKFKGYD